MQINLARSPRRTPSINLWYYAAQKLNEKRVRVPKGAVKIRFDQPSGTILLQKG
jgi:hypothetical protein